MMGISTHVLDTARGKPAEGVPVRLERQESPGKWRRLAKVLTDCDGRCSQLLPENEVLQEGLYRLSFQTEEYYAAQGTQGLYPVVEITFQVRRTTESHFHIPLLLSPNGYTTYRGN